MAEQNFNLRPEIAEMAGDIERRARAIVTSSLGPSVLNATADIDMLEEVGGNPVRLHVRAKKNQNALYVDEQWAQDRPGYSSGYLGVRGIEYNLNSGGVKRIVSVTFKQLDLRARYTEAPSRDRHEKLPQTIIMDEWGQRVDGVEHGMMVLTEEGISLLGRESDQLPELPDLSDMGIEFTVERIHELITSINNNREN